MNQPQMYESASISVFFPNMAAFILSPHVLILHMHDSSLLTYCICIFQIFHQFFTMSVLVTVTVNCTAGETLILPWKTTVRQDRFFTFFGVAVRFDWIKIGIWLKLSVLNYSSRPKLSLGSAHMKYGVWPGPLLDEKEARVLKPIVYLRNGKPVPLRHSNENRHLLNS